MGEFLRPRVSGPLQIALLQTTVFLVMRDPTFVTACLAVFVAILFSFSYLFLDEMRTAGSFLTVLASFLFVAFTSRAFYIRSDQLPIRV